MPTTHATTLPCCTPLFDEFTPGSKRLMNMSLEGRKCIKTGKKERRKCMKTGRRRKKGGGRKTREGRKAKEGRKDGEGRGRKVGEEGRKDLGRGAEDAAY